MQAAGIRYPRPKHGSNRSETPALHLGIWEKFRMKPKITNESWKMQRTSVRALIAQLCTIVSTEIAPTMVGILGFYYPELWERQQKILYRVRNELGAEFEEMPWLDFKGAFCKTWVRIGLKVGFGMKSLCCSMLGAGWSSKGATETATEDGSDLVVAGIKRCDP
ncbi:hypothetical protein HHX47_DHR4000204 [Lentinula edodes]|nr:hypothetical protein HHX47_DHR4000204 [Lentinula edodes]